MPACAFLVLFLAEDRVTWAMQGSFWGGRRRRQRSRCMEPPLRAGGPPPQRTSGKQSACARSARSLPGSAKQQLCVALFFACGFWVSASMHRRVAAACRAARRRLASPASFALPPPQILSHCSCRFEPLLMQILLFRRLIRPAPLPAVLPRCVLLSSPAD